LEREAREMSRNVFGWDYPAGAEHDPNAPWNQVDCPDTCASMIEVYSECGGKGECLCVGGLNEDCDPVVGECDCPSLEEIKADRAEARSDERNDL